MATIERDRHDRPLVVPPGGGKPTPYTRCTKYVSVLEDTYNLNLWQQRKVAEGLAATPALIGQAQALGPDPGKSDPLVARQWRDGMNAVCQAAKDAAHADKLADLGTYLHTLTEKLDAGEDVGQVPDELHGDLDAYLDATEGLKFRGIEEFVVQDDLRVGGTFDRLIEHNGRQYIGDLKTGSIVPGILKIAMQLGVYANSVHYDPDTHERVPHEADKEWGIIIHLPAGTGECTLHWVNIAEGWAAVDVARRVREKRGVSFKKITAPWGDTPPV